MRSTRKPKAARRLLKDPSSAKRCNLIALCFIILQALVFKHVTGAKDTN